ncbi:Zn-dependent protease [Thermoclostridium stercorarium subsp. stercorarium DSM 8532]|uniref:Zn-dependent protease n=2 Tax=Thermoclostridium stercorarium TaxID=1510 RepID=L7VV18_THES1|nr:site-2 protease family protein [Thermoclostridium stercorarium]AGC69433.1 Zn-dependent protease [Thermoclostridium stercorarium subsp. stercorarium DSM 8532]AGI40393.1 protease [Thermoclostridium stercorarium subsp. stercorarium DSM 8532]ANW99682.1 Zn-dependent protease [Thermoclostridium stercorarium subsp. thermolacticum DSM 2910]UZQ85386.1 site-2 protease family protein [Thermoclostridium stercorarium]
MRHLLIYLSAIIIHELFHVFAAGVLFREKLSVTFLPSGFSAEWRSFQPERRVQCIVYAFGPLGNIFAAVVSKALFKSSDADFVTANLLIGVFNLIPLYPLDGGNILLVLLYGRVGTDRTYEIMKMVGRGIRGLLLAAGIYILISGKNPSMLLTIIFLPGLGTVKRSVKRLNLSSLIRRKERILKKRAYQMRDILVLKNVSLGEALLLLDYDKYHVIHIADENLKILCEVTEQQLMDAILAHNAGKTLEEVFIAGNQPGNSPRF